MLVTFERLSAVLFYTENKIGKIYLKSIPKFQIVHYNRIRRCENIPEIEKGVGSPRVRMRVLKCAIFDVDRRMDWYIRDL